MFHWKSFGVGGGKGGGGKGKRLLCLLCLDPRFPAAVSAASTHAYPEDFATGISNIHRVETEQDASIYSWIGLLFRPATLAKR